MLLPETAMRRLLVSLLCLFALSSLPAIAAERVGLVLSGGAARGLAHIGVLKSLEEQGIRIDAIAGTSMGAIVGGLYAAGYSVAELERLAVELDWQQALSDSPSREDIPFRRKQDDRDFLIKQKLSFRDDGSLGLPLGVLQGQNLALLLESLLVHRSATRDFDHLPIPYRAVATDVVSGEQVIMSTGHLPQVMRASMSIPAVFAPVEVDGRLLVDGGMVNNVPIDVARQMGVDHVIVVDLGMPLKPARDLLTVVDVMNQSINLMMRKNSEAQLATLTAGDVLIQPPLAGFGVADFNRSEQMMEAGYRATQIKAEQLARLRTTGAGSPALAVRSAPRSSAKSMWRTTRKSATR
jgi:NTE family protein